MPSSHADDGEVRTGIATDIHAFSADSASVLVLGGVEWPGTPALSGHSDGDVVLHAIVDALLAAAGLGDMGEHFGTDRPEYRDASSQVFLDTARRLVAETGFTISYVSVQVVCAAPRIAPRRREVEARLTNLVGAPVSFTATTADGLGAIGRGEGVQAIAVATLRGQSAAQPDDARLVK